MKRRWRVLIALGALAAATVIVPVAYIEGRCRSPLSGYDAAAPYKALVPGNVRRPEARTFLIYPEWHIVYEAEAYARHLAAGQTPSSFPYGQQIGSFWTSYCVVNRATRGSAASSDAKIMIYTIGISYTVELAVKAAYERTIGRLFQTLSGWTSADDKYAARVQADYGRFMHETPWYRYPFGAALKAEWRISEPRQVARHWERRFALSAEYGVKAVYAALIDRASGATLGRDELTLQFVARATPQAVQAVDPRLKPKAVLPGGLTVVEAPRYQQFNDLLAMLVARDIGLVEIAGNDDLFVTVLLPDGARVPGKTLLQVPLERAGWQRAGITVKVPQLAELMRAVPKAGGTVEHVYDY